MNWLRILIILLVGFYIDYTYPAGEEQFQQFMLFLMIFITLDIGKICDLLVNKND